MKKILTITTLALLCSTALAQNKEATSHTSTHNANTTSDMNKNKANYDLGSSNTSGMNNTTNSTTNTTDKSNLTTSTYNEKDQQKWWHDRDLNNDGKITMKEYVKAETKHNKKSKEEAMNEFKEKDKDNDGTLNASEFKAWFEKMGDKIENGAHRITGHTEKMNTGASGSSGYSSSEQTETKNK